MKNCPNCNYSLETPLAKAKDIIDFYRTLTEIKQDQFTEHHRISYPIAMSLANKFFSEDSITTEGQTWLDALYHDVQRYRQNGYPASIDHF